MEPGAKNDDYIWLCSKSANVSLTNKRTVKKHRLKEVTTLSQANTIPRLVSPKKQIFPKILSSSSLPSCSHNSKFSSVSAGHKNNAIREFATDLQNKTKQQSIFKRKLLEKTASIEIKKSKKMTETEARGIDSNKCDATLDDDSSTDVSEISFTIEAVCKNESSLTAKENAAHKIKLETDSDVKIEPISVETNLTAQVSRTDNSDISGKDKCLLIPNVSDISSNLLRVEKQHSVKDKVENATILLESKKPNLDNVSETDHSYGGSDLPLSIAFYKSSDNKLVSATQNSISQMQTQQVPTLPLTTSVKNSEIPNFSELNNLNKNENNENSFETALKSSLPIKSNKPTEPAVSNNQPLNSISDTNLESANVNNRIATGILEDASISNKLANNESPKSPAEMPKTLFSSILLANLTKPTDYKTIVAYSSPLNNNPQANSLNLDVKLGSSMKPVN